VKRSSSRIYKLGKGGVIQPFVLNHMVPTDQSDSDAHELVTTTIEREAYEKGFEAGARAGMEFGKEKIERLIKRLSSIIEVLSDFKDRYYANKEKELVNLIMAVARKVVHAELSINRDVVINVTKAAINHLTTTEAIVIRVNPDDLEYLLQTRPDLLKGMEGANGFRMEGDPGVGKGGCIIQSNHGEVDARIEQGLKVIETAMKEAIEGET